MRIARATARPYKAAVTTLLVGYVLKFTGVPAEIFVDYQIHIRERVGGEFIKSRGNGRLAQPANPTVLLCPQYEAKLIGNAGPPEPEG
jgi:hypothetical protein